MYGIPLELKDSESNVTSFYGVWLDTTRQNYDLYRDSTLTDSFRIVLQDVCDHVEPSAVIDKYYDFNYTDEISKQDILNDKCEIKYYPYGEYNFIARCCTKYMPTPESLGGEYYGEITSFDILINSDKTWTTGNFGDYKVYDREHSMRHEVTHGIGIHHNDHSPLMRSDEDYNVYNPQRYITDNDRYNYHAIYNPPKILKPQETSTGYCDFLLDDVTKVNLSALKPTVLLTDNADIDFYLLNEDYTWDFSNVQDIVISRYHSFNPDSLKYICTWEPDPLLIINKAYKIIALYSGFTAKPDYMAVYPHDEIKIRFSDLTLKSPEYNKEYSVYAPLEFEVFGKSENAEVPIMDIYNIGSVEYLLEKKGTFWNTEIFTEVTDASTNFEFTKELSEITGLETGDYLVSVTAKDQQGATIAEIEEMPIRINTRSIQIHDPTSDEFMIYDFDVSSWYYTTWFVMAGRFYHEGLSNNDFRIPFPPELYDVKWCTENGVQVSVYSEDYPSELRVPDSTYAWTMSKWPGASKSSSSFLSGNADLYAESLNLQDSTHQGSLPMKDEQGVSWITDSSLNLRPGLYTFLGNMYDKKDYQNGIYTKLAETDTLQFLIPGWKMKTRIDPRYGKDRVHFRKTEDIEVCIWRPVAGLQANDTQVYLYDENKVTLLDSRTVTYSAGIGTSQAISFSTNNLDYGYYNLVAVETDYDTGIEVKFEKEIQVCPFYVNWESGGAWPSD